MLPLMQNLHWCSQGKLPLGEMCGGVECTALTGCGALLQLPSGGVVVL